MKNMIKHISALLLVMWYSLSIIGFGVHTCLASGETYIATVASGFSCEDLHPDHHDSECQSSCKCRHHKSEQERSGDSYAMKPCCKEEFKVISLTGFRGADDNDRFDEVRTLAMVQACPMLSIPEEPVSRQMSIYRPRSGISDSINIQAVYNIWRI